MKKLSLILVTLLLVTLLSACDITIRTVASEVNKAFLDAKSSSLTVRSGVGADKIVVASGTAGSTDLSAKYYKIAVRDIPQDVVYFEASNENVALTLYDSTGAPRRQSNSKKYFGKIGVGLTSHAALESQSITVPTVCRGSCIIVDKGEGVVYLRVAAKRNAPSASFKLYAFSDTYKDSTEPENQPKNNNACSFTLNSQGIVISPTTPHRGAIETVEDVDCFSSKVATNSVTLEAAPNTTFNIKARLLDQNGNPLKVAGTTTDAVLTVGPNNRTRKATLTSSGRVLVEISSADGRAAPSANSQYILTFNNPVR